MYNHSFAYKHEPQEPVVLKEGSDIVVTESIKHYFDAEGVVKLEAEQDRIVAAIQAQDAQKEIDDAVARKAAIQAIK